ncbi:hypothetical protein X751_30055 [Mesorhizobium sp. LNJC395A00]|nr:hypothetical protein X751_30055 [Mesorhizobium sp. LNJC395A00]
MSSEVQLMRGHFPYIPFDCGCVARTAVVRGDIMELRFDAVLLNTAVPRAADPVGMACEFGKGGRCHS